MGILFNINCMYHRSPKKITIQYQKTIPLKSTMDPRSSLPSNY